MTMRKVRIKHHKKRLETISYLSKKHTNRVSKAIDLCWTVKRESESVRKLMEERLCLRAQIALLMFDQVALRTPIISEMISQKLKRIDYITNEINIRYKGKRNILSK